MPQSLFSPMRQRIYQAVVLTIGLVILFSVTITLSCRDVSIQGSYILNYSPISMQFSGSELIVSDSNRPLIRSELSHADPKLWQFKITEVGNHWLYHELYKVGDTFELQDPLINQNDFYFHHTVRGVDREYKASPNPVKPDRLKGRLLIDEEIGWFESLMESHTVLQHFFYKDYPKYRIKLIPHPREILSTYPIQAIFDEPPSESGFLPLRGSDSQVEILLKSVVFPKQLEDELKRSIPPNTKPGVIRPKSDIPTVDPEQYTLETPLSISGIGIQFLEKDEYYSFYRPKTIQFSLTKVVGNGLGIDYSLYPYEISITFSDTTDMQIFGFYKSIPIIGIKMVILDTYPGYLNKIGIKKIVLYMEKSQ